MRCQLVPAAVGCDIRGYNRAMTWASATRVRCRRPGAGVLYETSDREDIAALARALATQPGTGAYCMCLGSLVLELDGVSPDRVTLHHGVTLRWEGSNGNAPLVSPDAIMDWLSARGMSFVREEYEDAIVRGNEGAAEAARWRAALPASLAPFFDDMRQSGWSSKPEWTAAIEAEYPDTVSRARVLLELYGSGVGRWSGYPSWESVPLQLLVGLPFETLIAAIADPTDRCCEGTIRLICSWDFRKRRKKLVAKLPEVVRARLLAHAQTLHDDNLETAIDALR